MKKIVIFIFLSCYAFNAMAVCTVSKKIAKLDPRSDGYVHIMLEGISNMDIMNCGIGNERGLMLNYNDTSSGNLEGKKMLYSALLAAFMSEKNVELCSTSCDSKYGGYSTLSYINNIKK